MSGKLFRGTYTAIVTPFNSDLSIDFDTFKKHLDHQIANGVNGIVVCGSTGESATLSTKEKVAMFTTAIEHVNKRVPIIAGSGSNNTQATIDLSLIAKELGADATLLVAPYYNKPSQEGLYNHYRLIAEAVDMPHIVYNVPGRSGVNILPEIQLRLAEECANIVATKEASGDVEQIMTMVQHSPSNFSVLSGDDAITLPLIAAGVDGVVSVLSNYAPKMFSDLVNFSLEGKFAEARELQYKLLDLMKLNFIEPNPVPAKTALQMMGMMEDRFRMPLMQITDASREKMKNALQQVGLI
jgi:4-hydroxy-tetrahydrodipicolinate synthase